MRPLQNYCTTVWKKKHLLETKVCNFGSLLYTEHQRQTTKWGLGQEPPSAQEITIHRVNQLYQRGYSLGSYLGQVGADEPAPVTTLGVELIESQSEHQFIKNRGGAHGIEVCIKRKEHFCCINPIHTADPAALILHIKATFKFHKSYKSNSLCLSECMEALAQHPDRSREQAEHEDNKVQPLLQTSPLLWTLTM